MNLSSQVVETSYAVCRQVSSRAGSSFYGGFLLLSREKRRAMDALYAFMRHTDDLADNVKPRPSVAQTDPRYDALAAWRTALERTMRGEPRNHGLGTWESAAFIGDSILPAVADTVRRFHVPHEHLYAVIEGVQMDLARRRYETFDDLRLYCQRVASAVGLACICVWGFRGPEAFEPANKCGIALQLTNILRDLKEDVAVDRVYLPLADLHECEYSVDDLRAGVVDGRFRRLMALEVARAEQLYAEGAELMDWLEPAGRRIFGLMMATYRALLRKIARRCDAVFQGRVRLSVLRRYRLAARWSLLPPRKAALR